MAETLIDSHDRKLLALVQQDADLTMEALADQVGLSPSAVQRRLKRLKTEKVIASTVAVVDPGKVGKPTFFIVALEIERERPELIARLRQWIQAEPQIQSCYYVTGTADFMLVMSAPDVEAYDALMNRLVADNPNVRRFTTNVVLSTTKRGLALPV